MGGVPWGPQRLGFQKPPLNKGLHSRLACPFPFSRSLSPSPHHQHTPLLLPPPTSGRIPGPRTIKADA